MPLHVRNPTIPKLCPGGYTKFPPVPCYPFKWMRENMEARLITDIDGFTINENKELVTGLMQKREYEPKDYKLVLDEDQVRDSLSHFESKPEWELRCILSEVLEVPLYLALWPNEYPIKSAPEISEPVITYKVKHEHDHIELEEEFKGDTKNLAEFILKFRGRSYSYVKKLNVGMTMMECYLASKTGNPWPGNLDAIVWDKEKNSFSAIIEFKTHNHSQYPISTQYFGQWGAEDTRRYKVLDIMQKHLGKKSSKPKFIFVIWGTHESHKEVKLQTIDDLSPSNDKLIKRPEFTDATAKDFTEEILKYISA